MKVAYFVYPSAFQNKGGGEILLEKTEEYLNRTGQVQVKRFDTWNDRIEDFDILHVFGSVKDCLDLMKVARSRNVKVVLESIFWSDLRRAFFEAGSIRKKIEMTMRHVLKLVCPFFPSSRRKMFQVADMIFPNSENEARQISRLFKIPEEKMFVIPNGVDTEFLNARPKLFLDKFGLKDFVLYVGRIEPRKNQLNLIRAMNNIGKDLVLIGDTVSGYEWYKDKCVREAKGNVHFLEKVEHASEILMSAYAACDLFVLAGWFETPGLVAMEAALAGAKIVATDGGSTKEYFRDKVSYLKPHNPMNMRKNIVDALARSKTEALKKLVIESFTWEKVAERMIKGYRKVMEK